MTDKAISTALRAILGPHVGIGQSDPRDPHNDLWDTERPAMARAVPKRVYEFAAGRRAARAAMQTLGLRPVALPQSDDRLPIWPQGLVGSITHCDTLCLAIVSERHLSLGIDIEPATPMAPDLIPEICTQAELTALARYPASQKERWAKKIFCAKEAIYKARYPSTRAVIGFNAISISLPIDVKTTDPLPFTQSDGSQGTVQVIDCNGYFIGVQFSCA